jgi:homoserine dehydrogenase
VSTPLPERRPIPPPERRPIIVLKFGSSVLRSEDELPRAVAEIARHRDLGRSVIAVVSAIGTTTDVLLEKAHRISRRPEPSALALMVATGEDVAAAFLTMALENAELPVALMEPVGIGLRCDGDPLDAVPCGLDTELVRRAIGGGRVGVVPGFYGRGPDGKIYLLGRGGSDLTALHLAHSLGAACRLLKDVDGVYDGDPGHPSGRPSARRYTQLSYDDALALRAKVVQEKALRFAREHGLAFEVAAPGAERATRIGNFPTRLADVAEPAAPAAGPDPDFTQQST